MALWNELPYVARRINRASLIVWRTSSCSFSFLRALGVSDHLGPAAVRVSVGGLTPETKVAPIVSITTENPDS